MVRCALDISWYLFFKERLWGRCMGWIFCFRSLDKVLTFVRSYCIQYHFIFEYDIHSIYCKSLSAKEIGPSGFYYTVNCYYHHKVTSHKAWNTPVKYPILDCKPDTREFHGNRTIQYSQRRSEERNIHWRCLIADSWVSWHRYKKNIHFSDWILEMWQQVTKQHTHTLTHLNHWLCFGGIDCVCLQNINGILRSPHCLNDNTFYNGGAIASVH